ncbi:hypothetical protein [Novosphingobium lentum]|uniref:hypothetical protein n=1 Tax=Novosphingobium lentum TaxID=145287 RepID=UPI0008316D78|nr:hypothetical protein [Novosphingobium lentum]
MRTRLSVCKRKQRYPDEATATAAAQAAGLTLWPYRCDRCRAVHLTSRSKGRRISGNLRRIEASVSDTNEPRP